MRIHLSIAAIAFLCCLVLGVSRIELVMVISAISLVFICEIINTAVERAVDTATQEYHPIAKIAKDVAAGAVLVAALNSVLVGLLVLGGYFVNLFMKLLER
jgi:diacylglycerol kinase (ATP)